MKSRSDGRWDKLKGMYGLLLMVGCFSLLFGCMHPAWGEDSGTSGDSGGTSTSGSNASQGSDGTNTSKSILNEEASKTTQKTEEDPRKREQNDDWVDATGAFQYKYPLNLPEGTNNLAPELTLCYNSHVSNGIMGMGWFIKGIPEIRRDFNYEVN